MFLIWVSDDPMADQIIEAIKARFDELFERYYRERIDDLIISFPSKRSLLVDVKDQTKRNT